MDPQCPGTTAAHLAQLVCKIDAIYASIEGAPRLSSAEGEHPALAKLRALEVVLRTQQLGLDVQGRIIRGEGE